MQVTLTKSDKHDKRLKAVFENKTIYFGQKGGSTYIDHNDKHIKSNWEARHKVREDWAKYDSAGALAKHILWNKPTIKMSIQDLNSKQKQYKFIWDK